MTALSPAPLRFGLVLDQQADIGGNFHQSLTDLQRFKAWCDATGDSLVVFAFDRRVETVVKGNGIECVCAPPGVLDFIFYALRLTRLFAFAQKALRWTSPFERRMKAKGVNLAYFLSQSKWHLLLEDTPFIFTLYDLSHRDTPEFPEVASFSEFERREIGIGSALRKAVAVVVNATVLAEAVERRYGVEKTRCLLLPFAVTSYLRGDDVRPEADRAVLHTYGLEPGYLFYPAQFWAHKNHPTLLRALAVLKAQGVVRRLVLCGSARGAEARVQEMIHALGLDGQVTVTGFVPSEHLAALYRGADALVMPTYFGPTNLPPLEAWSLGRPVIYPAAMAEDAGDAALLFDADDPASLAAAIRTLAEPGVRQRLVEAGHRRLQDIDSLTTKGYADFSVHMHRLRTRLGSF